MISKSNIKYCKTLFIDKPFGTKYSWKAKSAVFSKAINYILILIPGFFFSSKIIIMIVELLKFTANNALKSNKRLEKKKSKSLARKKKKATAIMS